MSKPKKEPKPPLDSKMANTAWAINQAMTMGGVVVQPKPKAGFER